MMRKINVSLSDYSIYKITDNEVNEVFNAYKEANIILSQSFESNKWKLTDEISNYTFDFNISADDFADYRVNLNISLEAFTHNLKVFILFKLGDVSMNLLRQFLYDLKKVLKLPYDDLNYELEDKNIVFLQYVQDFFDSIKIDGLEEEYRYLHESIENNIIDTRTNSKRLLVSFDSYFLFEDLLDRFWKESIDEDEKLFFFPIWFWWKLSSIIPMRPREVVITPRRCLRNADGLWNLTIRKDKNKGSNKKTTYKIDSDYKPFTFVITEEFAKEINWYLDKTKDYPRNELDTLFITDTHYKRWERCKPYTSRYFTYVNLNTCLRYFFEFIIHERFGYELIEDKERKHLEANQIHKFHLGDTRHLSLIGVIFSGAPASVAKVLAGHDSLDMGAHYYTNVSSFIETKTYRKYHQLVSKENFSLEQYKTNSSTGKSVEVTGGKCYSSKYREGNFEDCNCVIGPDGEFGYCQNCSYFRTSGRMFINNKKEYQDKLNAALISLKRTTNAVRRAKGYEEEITERIHEVNTIANEYSRYLLETEGDGKWQDKES